MATDIPAHENRDRISLSTKNYLHHNACFAVTCSINDMIAIE